MRNAYLLVILIIVSCSATDGIDAKGKWYTYNESGDYMELWIGEELALSYLSSIDEFFLYKLKKQGEMLTFSLVESRVIDQHTFDLKLLKREEKILQASFISKTKTDSLKTYFIVSSNIPDLKGTLEENKVNMAELFSRLEDSHVGHGH